MTEQLAGIPVLPGPYEIFDFPDKGVLQTRILKWEHGQAFIKTQVVPEGKWVEACRLFLEPGVKVAGMPYYDVTSKTLCAQLKPLLPEIVRGGRTVRIQKHGVAPAARFTVDVI